jgi:hypothetical protein
MVRLSVLALLSAAPLPAQTHDHGAPAPAPAPAQHDHAARQAEAPAHDHAAMTGAHGMTGALGDYAMTRDASGTAWQPDSSPMLAIMGRAGSWSTMIHGFATLVHDDQGGPRGDKKTFVASMAMLAAQRPVGPGTLTLRAMGSLDPLMGRRGYPLLLATGETADGRTELVDRQHPHDLFMELAAAYHLPIGEKASAFVYLGLPGEPALGPATYMHRFSGMANPEAPIGHHWLDSTHVTFGVATAGVVLDGVKLEGSLFTGREPDEKRYDIERPRMDSWSVRATWNPNADWSMQVSHGRLNSPEKLHPEEDVRRTTASVTYNRGFAGGNWQSTVAWGRNAPHGGDHGGTTDAFLVDSAVQVGRNTVFGRAERVEKDELFAGDPADPLHDRVFDAGKLTIGGYHSVAVGQLALDVGGLVSGYALPRALKPVYGTPASAMLFARLRVVGN